MWQRFTSFRIVLLLALLLPLLRLSGCRYLDLADVSILDYRFLQRGVQEASPEVVIIAIDDQSLEKLGRWPWPRTRVAQLIDRLTAAQAAVIGFDIVQSEPSVGPDLGEILGRIDGLDEPTRAALRNALTKRMNEDQVLAAAVAASQRTVLGYFFDDFDRQATRDTPAPMTTYTIVKHSREGRGEQRVVMAGTATMNLPELTAVARGTGFFNFIFDADGLYRRAPMAVRFGDQIAVPLSLAMLRVYWPDRPLAIRFAEFGVESVRVGSLSVPVAEDGQLAVNYRGPARTFHHIPAVDVLTDRVPLEELREKLVLVGVTATAVADVRATPFDGAFPGVEIHASVIDNILRQDFVFQPQVLIALETLVILALVLVLGLALQLLRGIFGALVAGGMVVAYLAISQWVFVSYGIPLTVVYSLIAISLTHAVISLQQYVLEAREKRKIRKTLELYLSPELARLISERPEMLRLGGERREHTVLFSDIRGFTAISEQLAPETLVELLNTYLGEMTQLVFSHDGMLDKYIGDAIMAVWSAPLEQPDHAARACKAALAMIARLQLLEEDWRAKGWPKLDIGIGLNSGPMVFGNMGSAQHLSLTVMGDEVNLASRLEGLNKTYGTHIVISEATLLAVRDLVVARELDLVRVKGKLQPVRIFELLGPASEHERWQSLLGEFDSALRAYRQRLWQQAREGFEAIVAERPEDGPAALYADRCRDMEQTPPGPEWDGVTIMESK